MVQLDAKQLFADSVLPASKDFQAAEVPEIMECSTDGVSEGEVDSQSPSLERTASQAAAQAQIQGVVERLEDRKAMVQDLMQSIGALNCEGDLQTLQETEQLMDVARKQARNLGEDLLEDLLALDKLSGLISDDRSRRKNAIAGIDALLEDVDASKARLASLQKQHQGALEAETKKRQTELDEAEADAEDMEQEASPHSPSSESSSNSAGADHRAQDDKQRLLPAPDRAMWKGLVRPVDFQTRQERGEYVLLARLQGLNTEDLEIELSDDQSALTIAGRCLPTTHQEGQMQQELLVQLQHLARSSPQRYGQLSTKLDRVAAQTYAELGKGKFGSFSETFRMPSDVDRHRIKASFDDNVLRITLPRKIGHAARPMTARHPYGHRRSTGLLGHPSFGW